MAEEFTPWTHEEQKQWVKSRGELCDKLDKIEAICRRHCSPAVVTSTHILALNVLKIIEGKG